MAPINGIPFLDYLIQSIVDAGIKHIVLLLGYKAEKVMERYGQGVGDDIRIEFSVGSVDELTGRRLLNAFDLLKDRFLLMYGDNYWPIAIDEMLDLYAKKKAKVLTTVFRNQNGTGEYGHSNNVEVSHDAFVRRYDKKRLSKGLNGVDIGYFIINKDCLPVQEKRNLSFEQDILPDFIAKRQLVAYMTDTQYFYLTNTQSLKKFEEAAKQNSIQPLPIRGRDMNFFESYVNEISDKIRDIDTSLLDAATKLIHEANLRGGKLIVAGNGGSASIASHVAVDLTKNTGIQAVNFNEASLITCLANDYGYERWLEIALEFYANADDVLILISSSGRSPNMINAAHKAHQMGLKLITFTGFTPNNELRAMGDINFWVDSHAYNVVEMTHHIWILAMVDKLIEDGKRKSSDITTIQSTGTDKQKLYTRYDTLAKS